MKTVAEEIEALRRLSQPELVARYEALSGTRAPITRRTWLLPRAIWKLQEQRLGGLSDDAKRRLDKLIADVEVSFDKEHRTVRDPLLRPGRRRRPPVGSALHRVWNGRDIHVRVVENGFEFDGVVYRSLSAVAKAVTGTHWNGNLFFGLTKRGKRR